MKKSVLLILIIVIMAVGTALAQTTAFAYQGKLTDGAAAANGPYDFTFRLFDLAAGGMQIGADVPVDDVQVTAGVFTVNLNFGSSPFTTNTGNYLEISVRPGVSTGAYTPLAPRQLLTSSPYSVQTLRAASAAVADNALNLGGTAANQFVQTGDSRLSDARTPLAGSTDYLQNTTTQQAASNFNVSGNGTVGGTLTGNIVNAAVQFNLGGNRILNAAGTNNLFAGINAGTSNTTGVANSFFGYSAGSSNTDGGGNSFFGYQAGNANTIGVFNSFFGRNAGFFNTTASQNSFFGYQAGFLNTTGASNLFLGNQAGYSNTNGANNSFVGVAAGITNTTGFNNSLFGQGANVDANNLSNATAIGANAIVSQSNSLVLGNNANVGIGTSSPKTKLQVAGGSVYIASPNSLIITSPNGTCWFITVNNAGALSSFSIACP